ncbi:MAG: hypothetical protein Fur003_5130 [Candidatus Dojkabacteria bacterium]
MLIGGVLLLAIAILWLFRKGDNGRKEALYKSLAALKTETSSSNPAEIRDLVIKLDTLLSNSFKYRYSNELTCGENLKKARPLFAAKLYNEVWKFHKLRNNVVHNNIDVKQSEAKEMYSTYQKAISKILG